MTVMERLNTVVEEMDSEIRSLSEDLEIEEESLSDLETEHGEGVSSGDYDDEWNYDLIEQIERKGMEVNYLENEIDTLEEEKLEVEDLVKLYQSRVGVSKNDIIDPTKVWTVENVPL